MIPAVVVSLVLVTSTIGLPLTTQQIPQYEIGLPQRTEKIGVQTSESYTPVGQASQTVQSEQYSPQEVEKIGYQVSSSQENVAIPKVENVPVNVEEPQPLYPQNHVLLPVQPLSVVPFNPTGQVLRPVVVPAEAIADGRVIITPIGSIQQRNFHQDNVFVTPESQHQEVAHSVTYTSVQNQGVEANQETYHVQPVEKYTPVQQEIQQTSQEYTPVHQEAFVKEQQVVKQATQPSHYQVQAIVTNAAEKQATYEVTAQVESSPQQVYNVQEVPEKQSSYQQTQVYTGAPTVVETVKKQVPSTNYETQNVEPDQHPQPQVYSPEQAVEKQTQVTSYTQSEQTEQQGQYQQEYSHTQQTVEKEAPIENVSVQSHAAQHVYQQQAYSVQPEQVENQVLYHQNVDSVSEKILKTSEGEPVQEFVNVQSYAGEPVRNFGDKLPQVQQTLSQSVAQSQENPVQPSVGSTQ